MWYILCNAYGPSQCQLLISENDATHPSWITVAVVLHHLDKGHISSRKVVHTQLVPKKSSFVQ